MRIRTHVTVSLIALVLTASLAFADAGNFKPGTEPEGFRDLKWGQRIDTMETMRESGKDRRGLVTVYERSSDRMSIGSVPLITIEYRAFEGRLYSVALGVHSEGDFIRLREILFARFGEGESRDVLARGFFWRGPNVGMVFGYNRISEIGTLLMVYNPIWDEVDRQEQELIREEAKDF